MSKNETNPSSDLVYSPLLHRFAIFLTVWAFLVVFVGGAVKSHEAGLSIPEPFIFKWVKDWYNIPNYKWEYFHRMIVGVLYIGTFLFMLLTFVLEKRASVRKFSIFLFVCVNIQAVIGYLTVKMFAHAPTSIPHAALGQTFLAMMAGIMTVLSAQWMSQTAPVAEKENPPLRAIARSNVIAVFIQLLLGAALRHDDHGKALVEGREWVFYSHLAVHVLGAVAVAYFMARVIMRVFRNHRSEPQLLKPTRYIMMLLGVQLMLGMGAAMFKIMFVEDGNNPPPIRVWTATAHVAVGALILLISALLMVRSYRYVSPAPSTVAELTGDPVGGVTA